MPPDPYASHVHRWSRLYMRWDFVDRAVRLPKAWPSSAERDEATTYADELLRQLGGSVDAAERRWDES